MSEIQAISPETFKCQLRAAQVAFAGDMRDIQRGHQERLRQLNDRMFRRVDELHKMLAQWHKENPDDDAQSE